MTAGCAICRRYSHSELPLCMLIPPARPISMGFSVPVRFICRRYSHSELPLCMLIPPARPISMGFSVPVRFRPWLPSGTLDYQESQLAVPSAGGIRIPSCRSACSYLQPVRYPWASAYQYASPGKKVGKKSKKWLIISGNDYIIYLYAVARKGICVRRRRE